jgi:hypothetical protein
MVASIIGLQFLPESNFDLVLSFQSILTVPHVQKYRTFGSQKYIYSYRTNAHTYPSGPAIVGNTSGTHLLKWCSAGPLHSA